MRQSYRLIWNTIVTWILWVFRLVPEIIFLPFLVHRIGEGLFGIYVLAWSIVPIFDILQNGLSVGVIKYCAEFFEKKDYQNINKILSSTCLILTIFSTVGFIIILSLVYIFPAMMDEIASEHAEHLRYALVTVSIMIVFSFPLLPYTGILLSLQRYDIFHFIKTGAVYFRVFGVIAFFLIFGQSFRALMLISSGAYFLSNFIIVVVTYRLVPQLKIRFSYCDKRIAKMILGFGSLISLWSVCRMINATGVSWMMVVLVSPAFVGVLAIMLKPPELMKQTIQAMSFTITPATSRYSSLKDHHMLRQLLTRSSRYITLISTMGMVAIVMLAKPVLGIWMGADYQYLYVYVIVLSGGTSILMSAAGAHHMLEGMGLLRALLFSAVVGLVITTFVSILLIFWITGSAYWAVVMGLSIGQIVTATIQIRVVLRTLRVKVWNFLQEVYGQIMVLALPVTSIIYLYCLHINAEGLLSRTIAATVAISLFTGLFMLIFLNSKEKTMIKEITQKIRYKLTVVR